MEATAAAATAEQQMEAISAALLIPSSPETLADRSFAYASLLQLQQQHQQWDAALSTLSASLLPALLSDISHHDEEIAAQALKCLGFMIYHPSTVPLIRENVALLILKSLARLVTTTKMKAICNLSVWCISVQQFDASTVDLSLDSLLRAIVHAMQNPFGSLSTMYEAMQAVVKLSSQLCERMRETACIWAPPIYKKLTKMNKKEIEMSERCLLKIEPAIFPPPLSLRKEVALDIKETLLTRLISMLQCNGQKLNAIRAWKWYIRLLGSDLLNRRNLINEMLKIPEKTFSDSDPCIQIASLAAWETLIDGLAPNQVDLAANKTELIGVQEARSYRFFGDCRILKDGILKRISLLMKPLVVIISSRSETSIFSSCLNTWFYLLSKLNLLVNHPSVKEIVLEPVLEAVFSKVPDTTSIWLWNSCLDLLDDCILSKARDTDSDVANVSSWNLTSKAATPRCPYDNKDSRKIYPIKWSAWGVNDISYLLKVIHNLILQGLELNETIELRILAFNAALRIFKSFLTGVQIEIKTANCCSDNLSYIRTILNFAKAICEEMTSSLMCFHSEVLCISLQFLEAIGGELEPSILISPFYKVVLDINYISDLHSTKENEDLNIPGISSFAFNDMITPMAYLNVLHFCTVAYSVRKISDIDSILDIIRQSNYLLCSYNPLVYLHAIVFLMYMHGKKLIPQETSRLKLWKVISENLKERIDSANDFSFLNVEEFHDTGYNLMQNFLSYPISVQCLSKKFSCLAKIGDVLRNLSEEKLWLEFIFKAWRSLFYSSVHVPVNFLQELFKHLVEVLHENITLLEGHMDTDIKERSQFFVVAVCGEVANCMLRHIQSLQDAASVSGVFNHHDALSGNGKFIADSIELISRVLSRLLTVVKADQLKHTDIARVFAAIDCIISCLHSKQDFDMFIEPISKPLTHWLSSCASIHEEMLRESIQSELQRLWIKILEWLLRAEYPVTFDDSFLRPLAPLLQITLNNSHPPISDITVAFCNAMFGKRHNFQYPHYLLPVLKNLRRKALSGVIEDNIAVRRKLVTPQKRISEDLEYNQKKWDELGHVHVKSQGLRSKRLKVVGHTREGKKAPYGKDDGRLACKLDRKSPLPFVKKNEEVRRVDCILQMLRKQR